MRETSFEQPPDSPRDDERQPLNTPPSSKVVAAPPPPAEDLSDGDYWVKVGPAPAAGIEPAVPKLFGFRVCDVEVVRLANALARKAKTEKEKTSPLSMSWCVGPCMRRLFRMLAANLVVPPLFLIIGFGSAHCSHGTLQYNYKVALFFLIPWVAINVYEEHICLRHITIPFAQHVGKWKPLGLTLGFGEGGSFPVWVFVNMVLTATDVFSNITPSLFSGVIVARWHRDPCGTTDDVDNIWAHMIGESPVFHHLKFHLTLLSVAFFLWLLQFAPYVYCFAKVWPGWRQWRTGAEDLNKGKPYESDLELEVVEFRMKPRHKGPGAEMSIVKKPRPHGTRFFYFTIFKEFLLTGAVFGIVGEAVGFSSLALVQREHARSSACYQLEVLQEISDTCSTEDFKRGVSIGKKFMQHYLSMTPAVKQKLLFKGILGDGVQLQLQITVFAIFKFLHPTRMSSIQLWISILAGFSKFPSIFLEVISIIKFNNLAAAVSAKLDSMTNHRHSRAEQVEDDLTHIQDMRAQSRRSLVEFYVFASALFVLYVWALVKLYMAHTCEDNLWNVNFDLLAGCVDLPDSLQHGGD